MFTCGVCGGKYLRPDKHRCIGRLEKPPPLSFTCTRCSGTGKIRNAPDAAGERQLCQCELCKGSGRI